MKGFTEKTYFIVYSLEKKLVIKTMNKSLKFVTNLGWKKFKDYRDVYLNCDFLFLADLFEKIRQKCWKNYV